MAPLDSISNVHEFMADDTGVPCARRNRVNKLHHTRPVECRMQHESAAKTHQSHQSSFCLLLPAPGTPLLAANLSALRPAAAQFAAPAESAEPAHTNTHVNSSHTLVKSGVGNDVGPSVLTVDLLAILICMHHLHLIGCCSSTPMSLMLLFKYGSCQ